MAWFESHLNGGSSPTPIEGVEHLFGLSDFIDNIYIDSNNGGEISYNGWSATDYISVTSGETLLCSSQSSWNTYNAWYDENKSFISSFTVSNSGATYTTITVPNNAKYFRISNSTSLKGTIIIWRELG